METPKTIVVPTDFSELSKAAFAPARSLAEAWGAQVVLVYVVPPETYPTYHVVRMGGFPNLHDEVHKAAMEQLETLSAEFGEVPVSVECREGRVSAEVEDVALQRSAGLIVVATHGHSGIKHAVLGSNAERIVRTSPVPVLSVRAHGDRAPLAGSNLKRVLVPTDFSDTSLGAFQLAQWFASSDTELLVAHVFEPPTYPDSPFGVLAIDGGKLEAELRTRAADKMQQWVDDLRAAHPKSRGTIVEGNPSDQLIRLAEEEQVDLIAISTHGHTGFKHLYLGSTAEKVVRKASCPVMTVRQAVVSDEAAPQ